MHSGSTTDATLTHVVRLLLALGALAPLACGKPAPRGVVLVVIDTLRADHLGAYGYRRETSPVLDALAADGTLFSDAVAPSPWTLPSISTLMTSLYPSVHGASEATQSRGRRGPDADLTSVLSRSHTTLAEILQERGFRTAAFIQGAYPSAVFGMDQGFDRFADNETPGLRFDVEAVLRWLEDEAPERFLVYLHIGDVHSPYTVPFRAANCRRAAVDERARALCEEHERYQAYDFSPGYRGRIDGSRENLLELKRRGRRPRKADLQRLVDLYDRSIAYTDEWIGRLIDGLRGSGLYDETIVVVTSDHGEEFFDHGGLEHGRTYFEEMMRVPLIVRVPGMGRGVVVDTQVGLVDVLPTLLDLLEIEHSQALQGRSVAAAIRGEEIEPHVYHGEASHLPRSGAIRGQGWKFVYSDGAADLLFDLRNDPAERRSLCPVQVARCRALRDQASAWRRRAAERRTALQLSGDELGEIDDTTRERLRALGYLDDSQAGEPPGDGDAP